MSQTVYSTIGMIHLDLNPLTAQDVPEPSTVEFKAFLDGHFSLGLRLAESMNSWPHHSVKANGLVQIVNLTTASSLSSIRKELGVTEYWCGRISKHTSESINVSTEHAASGPLEVAKSLTRRLSSKSSERHKGQNQAAVSAGGPHGLYERFRRGLLEYHSEHEREYIEACRETECLHVFEPHVAEVWRLTYVTPPPTSPRTFVVLLLSRELETTQGRRSFMNISLPFSHDKCPEKQGSEKSRVRGRYVSVEQVTESNDGSVEWRMATSSDAGGNIPRFMTNSSLPKSIAEDVPSFLKYISVKFPETPNEQTSAT